MTEILRVAVPSPLRRVFDYLAPEGSLVQSGARVRVPFGRNTRVGVVLEVGRASDVPKDKLRQVLEVLDPVPLIPGSTLDLLQWATEYYHHPAGEVVANALPGPLRKGRRAVRTPAREFVLTEAGLRADPETMSRAPRQAAVIEILRGYPEGISGETLKMRLPGCGEALKAMQKKAWLTVREAPILTPGPPEDRGEALALNPGQHDAVNTVVESLDRFACFLLEGVTGSGKTEVYLRAIERVTAVGRQALVLVPEIGLTPQMVTRFQARFGAGVAALHSGLSDGERQQAWLSAAAGQATVVVGTRSAVFVPLKAPGLLVVDEEHDSSFKQQDGFRYSARDLAVVRAQRERIPVVLGSATPSLESLGNAETGRYRHLRLPERAGGRAHPRLRLVDLRGKRLQGGLSEPLLAAMAGALGGGHQVLLFLNRRGYAPSLQCHACGWVADCTRCDAHMTYHRQEARLRCHHCGSERSVPASCPECGGAELMPTGKGTERLEEVLRGPFPGARVVRIDRDSTRRKGALQDALGRISSGEADILIGTQMLAKGHHFPEVTLVGIVDADGGLFSVDFRASERMAQLVIQVAGRAGRGEHPGEVLIQTHHPDHPLLLALVRRGYDDFARAALAERLEAQLPPYSYQALLRADAQEVGDPLIFLEKAADLGRALNPGPVQLLGPVSAPMERRAGRYRAQLLVQSPARGSLHRFCDEWLPDLERLKEARRVRWSLDIDPMDMT